MRTYCCVRGPEVYSEGLLVGLSRCWIGDGASLDSGISIVFAGLPPPLLLYHHITRGKFFLSFLSFPHAHKSFSELFGSRWQCIDTPGLTTAGDGIELKRDVTEYAA